MAMRWYFILAIFANIYSNICISCMGMAISSHNSCTKLLHIINATHHTIQQTNKRKQKIKYYSWSFKKLWQYIEALKAVQPFVIFLGFYAPGRTCRSAPKSPGCANAIVIVLSIFTIWESWWWRTERGDGSCCCGSVSMPIIGMEIALRSNGQHTAHTHCVIHKEKCTWVESRYMEITLRSNSDRKHQTVHFIQCSAVERHWVQQSYGNRIKIKLWLETERRPI